LLAERTQGTIHAFDTFTGLPERWVTQEIGAYATQGIIPELPSNVEVHVGLFRDTIPVFKNDYPGRVKFLNVDCDLYSSTMDVLFGLSDRFVDGTVIVFDEYFGYLGFEEHEMKAFLKFIDETGWDWRPIAVAPFCKQLAVELKEP